MHDLIAKEDGQRPHKFTVWNRFREVGEYETVDEVLAYVKQHPEGSYTVYLGDGVELYSSEVEEMRKRWRQ